MPERTEKEPTIGISVTRDAGATHKEGSTGGGQQSQGVCLLIGGWQVQSLDQYLPMLVLFSHPTLMYCDPSWFGTGITVWFYIGTTVSLRSASVITFRWLFTPGSLAREGKRGGSLYLPDLPVNCRYWYSRVSSRVFLRLLSPPAARAEQA